MPANVKYILNLFSSWQPHRETISPVLIPFCDFLQSRPLENLTQLHVQVNSSNQKYFIPKCNTLLDEGGGAWIPWKDITKYFKNSEGRVGEGENCT